MVSWLEIKSRFNVMGEHIVDDVFIEKGLLAKDSQWNSGSHGRIKQGKKEEECCVNQVQFGKHCHFT